MLIHGTRPRGEKQGSAKLTTAAVLEIRALKGTAPYSQIGQRFGVGGAAIGKIVRFERWGHI